MEKLKTVVITKGKYNGKVFRNKTVSALKCIEGMYKEIDDSEAAQLEKKSNVETLKKELNAPSKNK